MRFTHSADTLFAEALETGAVPGIVALAADREQVIYQGAFGTRTPNGELMELDSVVWLASMTKPITSVAALQLVEQNRIGLDAPLGDLVPELAEVSVLEGFDDAGVPCLRRPRRPITLRHLLTHTSGLAYRTWNATARRYCEITGVPDLAKATRASIMTPLVSDPGERWEYGISTDWVGQVVERVSGLALDKYFRDHILDPLGMTNTGFTVRPDIRARFADLHARQADGSLSALPFAAPPSPPEFYAGGGDLYSTGPDYLRFLRMLLGGGEFEGVRLLQPEMVAEMGRNQIGELTAGVLTSVDPVLSADIEFFPGVAKGWGFASMITREAAPTGRATGTLSWAGVFNTYFWVDPIRSVAGVMLTQVIPFGDPAVIRLYEKFEASVYSALEDRRA